MNRSSVFAVEKLPPEKAYLNDVYKNMMDVNNLHYDVVIQGESPMGEVKVAINGEGQEKPLSCKQDMNIWFWRDMGAGTLSPFSSGVDWNHYYGDLFELVAAIIL